MSRRALRRVPLFTLLWAVAAASGCYTGKVDYTADDGVDSAEDGGGADASGGDGDGDGGPESHCALPDARVWRLSPRQHDRSIWAIFPDVPAASAFLEEGLGGMEEYRFHNEGDSSDVTVKFLDAAFARAEVVAERVAADPSLLAPCLVDGLGDDACSTNAFESLLTTAYRRPPTAEEVATLVQFARQRAEIDGEPLALADAVQAVLTSPSFLFRTELGAPDDHADIVELDAFEKASALSYFLLDGPPDQALLEAAASGELDGADAVESHARRLLAEPAAAEGILRFFSEYTQTYRVENVARAAPEFDAALAREMARETEAFAAELLTSENATFRELMTASWSVVSPRLADVYGVQVEGDDWTKVAFDPDERAGILTQAGALTAFGKYDHGDPVFRGRFIRERLLCSPVPEVDDEGLVINPRSGIGTARDQLEQHLEDDQCRGCHVLMDPLGLPLERYDVIGRFRLFDGEYEVDPSGALYGLGNLVEFDDAIDMAHVLADHPGAQSCFLESLFHYAYGRAPRYEDSCEMQRLAEAFESTDGDIAELVVEIVTSQHFTHRRRAQ